MVDWHSRYRRIIDAYRMKLMDLHPAVCIAVDATVEDWVSNDSPIEMDRLMSAAEIAEQFGFNVQNIRDWARRHPDEIVKHHVGGKVKFRLGEVLRYQARKSATKSKRAKIDFAE